MHQIRHKTVLSFFLFCSLLGALAGETPAQADRKPRTGGHFNEDGFLLMDGKPRLILGMYELPDSDAGLNELAEAGFNLVRVPQDAETLDKVRQHGLHAWICLGSAVQLGADDSAGEPKLTQIIDRFKEHPALLVWELPDEALWNVWWRKYAWIAGGQQRELRRLVEKAKANATDAETARRRSLLDRARDCDARGLYRRAEEIYEALWEELQAQNPHPQWKMSQCRAESRELIEATARGCRVVRRLDPAHPIWQNHAPRNSLSSLRRYNEMVDAAGCDIYPVPPNYGVGHSDLKDTSLTAVGAYTDRMSAAAPGKSAWMVLQGFGWRDLGDTAQADPDPDKGRRPRYEETRFMAYDALAHGANAILYWGTHAIEKDSTLWRDLMRVTKELRALEPVLVAARPRVEPVARVEETFGSIDGDGPRLMLRRTGRDWALIAVNEHAQGIAFDVNGLPAELEGKTLHRLYSDETQTVRNGGFRDGIRGFGVHVYATTRDFEVE